MGVFRQHRTEGDIAGITAFLSCPEITDVKFILTNENAWLRVGILRKVNPSLRWPVDGLEKLFDGGLRRLSVHGRSQRTLNLSHWF